MSLFTPKARAGISMSGRSAMRSSEAVISRPQVDPRSLDLRVAQQSLEALVAALAGLLVAEERHGGVAMVPAVDVQRAGLEFTDGVMRRAQVARPHRCLQPVDRVVGDAQGVVESVNLDQSGDRTEDFLLRDGHAVVDMGEQRRVDVIARAVR